jgi:glyoxylase-like metal-dependent hydrolase (beta-lactamase superfamily II)
MSDDFVFEAVDAGHGDAIILHWVQTDPVFGRSRRFMLIDGGPGSTQGIGGSYAPLKTALLPRLTALKAERDADAKDVQRGQPLALDVVVCTHVHNDHVDGIQAMFADWAKGPGKAALSGLNDIRPLQLWHNSFAKILLVDIDKAVDPFSVSPEAIGDGEALTKDARRANVPTNRDAPGNLIAQGQVYDPDKNGLGFAPMRITILTPGREELKELQKEWEKEALKTAKKQGGVAPAGLGAAPAIAQDFADDDSVLNLSSIAMLVEGFGRKVLLTGDQRGDYVMRGLERVGLKAAGKPFHVDVMKVPHHGSTANVQAKFVSQVTADTYVFSANGRDQNPDPPILHRIALQAKQREIIMAFTNPEMRYAPKKKGEFPVISKGGPPMKTLRDVLDAICDSDPDIRKNLTITGRKAGKHSLVLPLR